MSDFLELAKTRRSVRTFDEKPIDENLLEQLKVFANEVANPYNIPVRFEFLDAKSNNLSSPVLTGENMYITAVVDKGQYAEEAYGYSFEALLMKAHELGLGTVWIGGTMPRGRFEEASNLSENQIMPCVSPIGYIAKSMSMKEGLMRKGVKADKRFDFDKLFFNGSFDKGLSEEDATGLGVKNALEAVRVAPSAVNKQPWRVVIGDNVAHFYIKHDKGYVTENYDLQKIDLGIGMYHFEAQLVSEGKNPVLEVKNPGIQIEKDMDYIASYKF